MSEAVAELVAAVNLPPEADWELIHAMEKMFGQITVDLAADAQNTKADLFIDEARNSFMVNWIDELGFRGLGYLNPPPGDIRAWINKAEHEAERGAKLVVIMPVAVDTPWFWRSVVSCAAICVISPRMMYDGVPTPLCVAAYNIPTFPAGSWWMWRWQHNSRHRLPVI